MLLTLVSPELAWGGCSENNSCLEALSLLALSGTQYKGLASSSPFHQPESTPSLSPFPLAAHTHPGPEVVAPAHLLTFSPRVSQPHFSLSLPLPQSLSPAEPLLCTTHCVYKKTMTVFYFSLLSPFLP